MEWNVLIALFKATCEQQGFLVGETKQHSKLIFNRWLKEGDKILKVAERESDFKHLEEITEVIENSIHELRLKYRKEN
jgi:hypothetical protein